MSEENSKEEVTTITKRTNDFTVVDEETGSVKFDRKKLRQIIIDTLPPNMTYREYLKYKHGRLGIKIDK